MKVKTKVLSVMKNERGDISVKTIAITVAIIVVIAAAMTYMKDEIPTWIDQIWDFVVEQIENLTN